MVYFILVDPEKSCMEFSNPPYASHVLPCNFSRFNYRIICDDKHNLSIHNKLNYISSVVRKFITIEEINKLTIACLTIRENESFIKISDILQTNLKVYRLQSIRGMLWIEANFQVKEDRKNEKEAKSLCQFRERNFFFFYFLRENKDDKLHWENIKLAKNYENTHSLLSKV